MQDISKSNLEEVVHGDPEENEVGEIFQDVESAVNDPVGKPLCVVIPLRTFYCFKPRDEMFIY